MATSIKAELELDASNFQASVTQAKQGTQELADTSEGLAQALNEAARKQDAATSTFKTTSKELNKYREIAKDAALKMHLLGESAKDTSAYKNLQKEFQAAHDKALELKAGLDAARDSVEDLRTKSKVEIQIESIKGDLGNIDNLLGTNFSGITAQIESLTQGFNSLGNMINTVKGSSDKGTSSFTSLSSSIQRTISDANQGKGVLGGLNTAMSNAAQSCGALGQAFSRLGVVGKLGWIGAAVAAVAGIATVFSQAVPKSAEFGRSISQLGAITGVSGKELDRLRSRVVKVAKETYMSAKDVAQNFADIGSALPDLLKNAKGLEEVSRAAITLKKAGTLPLKEATDALTLTMAQFNIGAEEATRVIDVLANGTLAGSATIKNISETLHNCGTAANVAGLSLEETTAIIEVLATQGQRGAEAGTMLKTMFTKMSTGADEFNPRVVGLSTAIKNLSRYSEDAGFMQKTFGDSAAQAATIIAKNVAVYEKLIASMQNTGTAMDMAIKNSDNLATAIDKLKITWDNFLSTFDVEDGMFANLFRGAVDGVSVLIAAIDDLFHAFAPLFELDIKNAFDVDVNPLRDIMQTVADVIELVATLIDCVLSLGNAGETAGNVFGNQFTSISTAIQSVNAIIEVVTDAVKYLIYKFIEFRNLCSKKVANIPLLSDLAKGIGKIIDSIKSVLRWIAKLKRELHLAAQDQEDLVKNGRDKNGNIIRKERHPKKVEEKKQIKDMSLPELEQERERLKSNQHADGINVLPKKEYQRQMKEINNLIAAREKLLGIDDDKKSSKSGKSGKSTTKPQPKAAIGSLTELNKQMNEFNAALEGGRLQISTEEAQDKLKKFREQIRKKEIQLGKYKAGSIRDLNKQLSQATEDAFAGITDAIEYEKIQKQLEEKIEAKEIELKIAPQKGSLAYLEKEIGKIQSKLDRGEIKIDVEVTAAKKKIRELENEKFKLQFDDSNDVVIDALGAKVEQLRERMSNIKIDFRMDELANAINLDVNADTSKIDNLKESLKLFNDLYEKTFNRLKTEPITITTATDVSDAIRQMEAQFKSIKVLVGVDGDLTDLRDKLNDLQKSYNAKIKIQPQSDDSKQDGRSTYEKAVETTPLESMVGDKSLTRDERLDVLQTLMDANDEYIRQLREIAKAYSELGEAGSDGFSSVNSKIDELVDKNEVLSEQASKLDKKNRRVNKWAKGFDNASSAVGDMAGAFSALGGSFEDKGLNIAGIIGGAVANVFAGMAQAMKGPFSNPWEWIAFGVAAAAQAAAVVAQIHSLNSGGYASGGVIQSTSRVGDMGMVRVNGGEMIMNDVQQQRLWNIVSGSNSWNYSSQKNASDFVIESRISGRDLVLAMRNNEKHLNNVGKSMGIK